MKRLPQYVSGLAVLIPLAALTLSAGCQQQAVSPTNGPVIAADLRIVDSVLTANQNQWVLLNVWATWCRPCIVETPDLVEFAHSTAEQPLTMIALSTDYFTADDTTAIRKVHEFQHRFAVPYANLVFTGTIDELTERFSLTGSLPTTILIDPSGNQVQQFVGIVEHDDLAWIENTITGASTTN